MRFLALLFVMFSTTAMAQYSIGYRMGQLTKYSVKGIFVKSGEGQLLMGRESSPYYKTVTDSEGKTTKIRINPWHFSADKNQKLDKFVGEYVFVKYKEDYIRNPFASSTSYHILEIQPVIREPLSQKSTEIDFKKGSYSDGIRMGRIVKASKKGTMVKTWEIILQQGNAGNQFKNLSTGDERIFNFAVECLQKAKKVKVYYTERSAMKLEFGWENSGYSIYKIEEVSDI